MSLVQERRAIRRLKTVTKRNSKFGDVGANERSRLLTHRADGITHNRRLRPPGGPAESSTAGDVLGGRLGRGFGDTLMRLKQKYPPTQSWIPRGAEELRGVGGATSCHHVSKSRL